MRPGRSQQSVRDRLRAALPAALKARDADTVAALRTALAAIDNAEAVDPHEVGRRPALDPRLGSASGNLAAGEAPPLELSEREMIRIVEREIAEHEGAAREYEHAGRDERALALRRQADVLASILDGAPYTA